MPCCRIAPVDYARFFNKYEKPGIRDLEQQQLFVLVRTLKGNIMVVNVLEYNVCEILIYDNGSRVLITMSDVVDL
jgi:hypothetical protein